MRMKFLIALRVKGGSESSIHHIFFTDAMAYRGDLMACEVDFEGARNDSVPVTFFKNNIEVARTSLRFIPDRTKLFPFIGMGYTGIRVLAKVCSFSFRF